MQEKVIIAAGGAPTVAVFTTTLVEWNIVLETGVLIFGLLTGALSAYVLLQRIRRNRREKIRASGSDTKCQ
jgi:hypothetical protein